MVNIDLKDRKILYQLLNNSRQPLSVIGKKVGLSRKVVGYRIKKLEDEGVILGYRTSIEPSSLGFSLARFYYSLQFTSPEIKKEIIDFFSKSKCTNYVAEIEGSYDLEVGVFTNFYGSNDKFISFYDETQRRYRQYFDDQIGSIYNGVEVFDCVFLSGEKDMKPKSTVYTTKKPAKIDDIDINILQMLARNSRIPTVEIAKELNATVITINNRIKKLINANVILRFMIIIDWLKLGYRNFYIEINLKDYNKKYQIMEYVRNNPNLYGITHSIGYNIDLDFDFLLQNVTQLHETIKDLSAEFPDSIKNFKYYSLLKIHKWIGLPQL